MWIFSFLIEFSCFLPFLSLNEIAMDSHNYLSSAPFPLTSYTNDIEEEEENNNLNDFDDKSMTFMTLIENTYCQIKFKFFFPFFFHHHSLAFQSRLLLYVMIHALWEGDASSNFLHNNHVYDDASWCIHQVYFFSVDKEQKESRFIFYAESKTVSFTSHDKIKISYRLGARYRIFIVASFIFFVPYLSHKNPDYVFKS